jgi:gp18
MFEPPLVSQLLGTGVLVIGFLGAGILAHQREQQEIEERRLQEEHDTQVIRAYNELIKTGRELERQEIHKNIRSPFKGFTYDTQPPTGLASSIEDVPQVFRACIEDYDRLASDYQEEARNNDFLRSQNANLLEENGRLLYQEMTMDFRQNPSVNFGHPIVAKKMKPNGYYLPRSEEERQAGLAPYRRQILTEQKNLAAVMNIDLEKYWGNSA